MVQLPQSFFWILVTDNSSRITLLAWPSLGTKAERIVAGVKTVDTKLLERVLCNISAKL
ncbi:MAG: hypothetical protein LBC44_03735 [Mycoplasmataceae bacterium]|nr:hypothetical protein [Mycoplasmataceae bacterium]